MTPKIPASDLPRNVEAVIVLDGPAYRDGFRYLVRPKGQAEGGTYAHDAEEALLLAWRDFGPRIPKKGANE